MPPETLTPERVLEATEDVLRRYGPAKANVVDVARALGVSHGSVYRHFPTKKALREAVTERWLERAHAGLHLIAQDDSPAAGRLGRWLDALFAAKRRTAGADPELLATLLVLMAENSGTVVRHLEEMIGQIEQIVEDGVASGEFTLPVGDARTIAHAVWDAASRFHDPRYAHDWTDSGIDQAYRAVRSLILSGLCQSTTNGALEDAT